MYETFYRSISGTMEPLSWDVPISAGQELTLRRFLFSLLDAHMNNNLRTSSIDWLLKLLRGLLPPDVKIPQSRQEYERLVGQLEDNTRFYVTCASHCAPCSRTADCCSTCKEPLWLKCKPAGLFYLRDPRRWVAKLRTIPALQGALRYPVERLKDHTLGAALEDVWDGKLFQWLLMPNAPPLFKPRTDPLPARFSTTSSRVFYLVPRRAT